MGWYHTPLAYKTAALHFLSVTMDILCRIHIGALVHSGYGLEKHRLAWVSLCVCWFLTAMWGFWKTVQGSPCAPVLEGANATHTIPHHHQACHPLHRGKPNFQNFLWVFEKNLYLLYYKVEDVARYIWRVIFPEGAMGDLALTAATPIPPSTYISCVCAIRMECKI